MFSKNVGVIVLTIVAGGCTALATWLQAKDAAETCELMFENEMLRQLQSERDDEKGDE